MFSLEMTAEQNALRLLSTESKESLEVFRKDGIAAHQWQPLVDAQARLNSVPFFIDDTPAITTLEIRGRLRNLQRERSRKKLSPIVVVGVDYLQLVKGTGYNREQEVASVTRTLKEIARTEKVCILAVSQLNRAVETQKDKRPSLKDLRESGAIEQDADGVWFIYREGYYNKGCANPNEAEIGIAKQRNGPTGTVKVRWNSSCVKFENAADVYDDLMPAEDPNPKYEYYDQIDDL